jgi:hypothetical protein
MSLYRLTRLGRPGMAHCRTPAPSPGGRLAHNHAPQARGKESVKRFLNINGPGNASDDDFRPGCHVQLDHHDDYSTCPLCRYDTRQHGQRQLKRQRP